MTLGVTWSDVAIRILLTVLAGAAIGFERGEQGHAAGLRTTLLVSLAACLAMLQANWLMTTVGKASDSFVTLDLMRLPLGILSGVGFIGAGTILKRGDLIVGVTTAATLWYVTMLGLCFGGGQIGLGLVGTALGILILPGLKLLESHTPQERIVELRAQWDSGALQEADIRRAITEAKLRISRSRIAYHAAERTCEGHYTLTQRTFARDHAIPAPVRELTDHPAVHELDWRA
jgi:putative Mg2+ transporter-C (MgtC) family protein